MEKIKFITSVCDSKVNQMIVPVEVFGVMIEMRIPIGYAVRRMRGTGKSICYRNGLTKEQEEWIIKYYEDRIFERILLLMFYGEIKCKEFLNLGITTEFALFRKIGYTVNTAYFAHQRSKVIDEIIDKIIFDYPVKSVSKWCIGKYKEELESNRIIIEKEKETRKARKAKSVFKASVVKVAKSDKSDINLKLDILKEILLGGESKEKKVIENVVSLHIEKKKLIVEKQRQIELLQKEIKEIMALSTK